MHDELLMEENIQKWSILDLLICEQAFKISAKTRLIACFKTLRNAGFKH